MSGFVFVNGFEFKRGRVSFLKRYLHFPERVIGRQSEEHFVRSCAQPYLFLQNIFDSLARVGVMACLPILIVERQAFFLPIDLPGLRLSVDIDQERITWLPMRRIFRLKYVLSLKMGLDCRFDSKNSKAL